MNPVIVTTFFCYSEMITDNQGPHFEVYLGVLRLGIIVILYSACICVVYITFGHDQSWYSSGGNSGAHGITLLLHIHPPVPPSVHLSGSKHVTSTAHVTKSSLTGSVGTTTTNTWNTCDSTTSTP